MTQYKIDILNYKQDGSVRSDCADITFYNTGPRPVVINESVTIGIGQSLSLTANANEIDRTIYSFKFLPTVNIPGSITIFRKIYI